MQSPDKPEPPPIQHMYVLRLWREGAHASWRASVKAVSGGKERHFASLENLCVFLQTETAPEDDEPRRNQP